MEGFPVESTERTPSLAEDPALGLSHRAKLEILGAVLLALFLGALDQTIVGTALPKIVTQLGGNEVYNWVFTIYLLTSTITVPFYGKLSDLYGRKPLLMLGVTIFLVGSALSGLSQDITQLILFRGIQGIGAGALFPISLAVIGDRDRRATRLGIGNRYQYRCRDQCCCKRDATDPQKFSEKHQEVSGFATRSNAQVIERHPRS